MWIIIKTLKTEKHCMKVKKGVNVLTNRKKKAHTNMFSVK